MAKIYVASPFGFFEAGRSFMYQEILPSLEKSGFEVIDPWQLTDKSRIDLCSCKSDKNEKERCFRELNKTIGKNNAEGLEKSDFVLAILDGTDIDSGTASEIGLAYARGKTIVGYRSDLRKTGENEGVRINLQVEYFIMSSGGEIFCSIVECIDFLKNKQIGLT